MFQIYFTDKEVHNYADSQTCDTKRFLTYFREMLNNEIFIPPSQYECNFVSIKHTEDDLDKTADAIENSLRVAFDISPEEDDD